MAALAETFKDDKTITVVIMTKPSTTGLCKVRDIEGHTFARHTDRLDPINQEAHDMIEGKEPFSP